VQAVQLAPWAPHAASVVPGMHVVPEQQPFGHDAGEQRQLPDAHSWPGAHSGPAPQWHAPSAPQVCARTGSHAEQIPPARPHADALALWQVPPEQQPAAQVAAVQAPVQMPVALQALPPAHFSQPLPPLPHAESDVPATQVVPEQQPAHDSPSQTQFPPLQR
jgi:hypothetical protein